MIVLVLVMCILTSVLFFLVACLKTLYLDFGWTTCVFAGQKW